MSDSAFGLDSLGGAAAMVNEKWWLTELGLRREEEQLAREELLEDGPGSSEEDFSDDGRDDNSDAETLVDDDDFSGAEDAPPPADASSHGARPLPLASGIYASQSSYHRTPSSQLL